MSPKTPCAGCRSFHVRDDEIMCDLGLLDWSIAFRPQVQGSNTYWIRAFNIRFPIQCDGFALKEGKE